MPSIKNVLFTMAFAAAVSAQSAYPDSQIQEPTAIVEIPDGQIQVPTSEPSVPTAIEDTFESPVPTAIEDTFESPVPTAIEDTFESPVPTAIEDTFDSQVQVPTSAPPTPLTTVPAPIVTVSSGVPVPTNNGTFTTGAPGTTPSPFTGAASILGWSREIAVIGVAAVGLAML